MRRYDPWWLSARNQNNNRERDAGITVAGFLQAKDERDESEQEDSKTECKQVLGEVG